MNEIPLPALPAKLADHGLKITYNTLWRLSTDGAFQTARRGNSGGRIFALGTPESIAAAIKKHCKSAA